jgi:hypothetical protein
MQWVAAAVSTAVSDVVVACELIRAQTFVARPEAPQPDTGPFTPIGSKEDHTLILKRNPDGGSCGLGRMRLRFSLFDSHKGQARPSGQLGLRQTEERPSSTQLRRSDGSLVRHGDTLG